jgi:hypothetical protein
MRSVSVEAVAVFVMKEFVGIILRLSPDPEHRVVIQNGSGCGEAGGRPDKRQICEQLFDQVLQYSL